MKIKLFFLFMVVVLLAPTSAFTQTKVKFTPERASVLQANLDVMVGSAIVQLVPEKYQGYLIGKSFAVTNDKMIKKSGYDTETKRAMLERSIFSVSGRPELENIIFFNKDADINRFVETRTVAEGERKRIAAKLIVAAAGLDGTILVEENILLDIAALLAKQ